MADPAPAASDSDSKGGPSPLILAIVVLVVALGGGFALAYFVLPARIAAALQQNQPPATGPDGVAASTTPAAPAPGGPDAKPGEGAKVGGDSFVLSDILVNIAGTHAGRFLKATAYFDAPPNVVAELEQKRAKITDIVSATLGGKSLDELSDPGVRGKLRSELLATINPLLETKGEVTNIYFPEFIIQ